MAITISCMKMENEYENHGLMLWILGITAWKYFQVVRRSASAYSKRGYDQLVGHTPLIELRSLSSILGVTVLAKMEASNPGGTGKDRAVKHMLDHAEQRGILRQGMTVFEGSSGSTGIALAFQCLARGYKLHVVMPDDQSNDKKLLLEKLKAFVTVVPCCSIANRDHYVNTARRLAEDSNGFFVDQFENISNYQAHYEHTGPEVWAQTNGQIDAFVMSSGTGGTIAGVSRFLKEQNPNIKIILADPTGSSLFNKVRHNVCYTDSQAEKKVRKHRHDSIVEGVGLDRITANFSQALIDEAYEAKDQEVVNMAQAMLRLEGLFIGSSSALNLAVACKAAANMPRNSTLVTVICDNGSRHMSRFWNDEFISSMGLEWPTGHAKETSPFWEEIVRCYVK